MALYFAKNEVSISTNLMCKENDMMKLTKKIGIILCVTSILLATVVVAQTSDSTTASNSTSTSTSGTDNSSVATTDQGQDSQNTSSALVIAIEDVGDLDEVAEALYLTGTDDLLATMDEGVTIFAPVDGSFDQGIIVEDVITNYIVPEVIDTATMDDSSTVVAMSGEPVTITLVDEIITVNGIPVAEEQAIYSGNVVVYKLSDSFDNDTLASTK